jgi:hypothetical protein
MKTLGPFFFTDELIYKIDAVNIFRQETFTTTHYPPLYPLLLSPAFFSKDHWYDWMFYINAFLSSLVLIPVWIISLRFLSRSASFFTILLAGLTSFQIHYPRLIISENLHVPLFSFSVLLLLSTGEGSKKRKLIINTLFGVAMALGYLTKYLYLGAVPVLVFLWWIKPLFYDNPEKGRDTVSSRLPDFFAVVAGFSVTYFPWLMYVHYSSIPLAQGLGAEFVKSGVPDAAGWKSLVLWVSFYLSYFVVELSPFLLILSLYLLMLLSGSIENDRRETFFMITVIILSFIFAATAIQHSWRAGYNYPVPKKLMGRYLLHLMPLWLIVFMIALNKIKNSLHRLNVYYVIFCSLLVLGALFYALVMLTIIQDAQGLNFSFINAPAVKMFIKKPYVLFFVIIFFPMFVILAAGRRNTYLQNRFIHIFSISLLLLQIISSYTVTFSHGTNQLHGRALSSFIERETGKNGDRIVVINDESGLDSKRLKYLIRFWLSAQAEQPVIKILSLEDYYANDLNWPAKIYVLTKDPSDNPVYKYVAGGQSYYVRDFGSWLAER